MLRATYMKTSGYRISRLENVKRAAVEFLVYMDQERCEGHEKPKINLLAKHQLQEDIATLRRVKRVPLPGAEDNVDVKKLLQSGPNGHYNSLRCDDEYCVSDEILPSSYFQISVEPTAKTLRLTAMRELVGHLSCDNISHWNRAIGR